MSTKHYRHAISKARKDTTALRVGRALHTMVLDANPQGVAVFEGATRRGKAWDAFEAEHDDEIILKRDELEACDAMRAAVRAHPIAGPLLAEGEGEVTCEWTMLGHACKGRIDWLRPDNSMVELKTTRKIDERGFRRDFGKLLYHAQIAFYSGGLAAAIHPREVPILPRVVVVENQEPYDVAVYRIGYDTIEPGQRRIDDWIRKLGAAKSTGRWPGVSDDVIDMVLDEWVRDAGLDDVDLSSLGGDDNG